MERKEDVRFLYRELHGYVKSHQNYVFCNLLIFNSLYILPKFVIFLIHYHSTSYLSSS